MSIIEYSDKYLEDVRDSLVELEEYFKSVGCEYVKVDVFASKKMDYVREKVGLKI